MVSYCVLVYVQPRVSSVPSMIEELVLVVGVHL